MVVVESCLLKQACWACNTLKEVSCALVALMFEHVSSAPLSGAPLRVQLEKTRGNISDTDSMDPIIDGHLY